MKTQVEEAGIKIGKFQRPTFIMVLVTFGTLPVEFLHAVIRLQVPLNCTSHFISTKGMEIGVARCQVVQDILAMGPKRPKYVLWLSDDELPDWDALVRLWMEIEKTNPDGSPKWDILTSLVFLKCEPPEPVLWSSRIRGDGPLVPGVDFKPGDVIEADVGDLGFGLMRTDVFEKLEPPFFKTGFIKQQLPDLSDKVAMYTEDCYFFDKAKRAGLKIGVHTGVKTAHFNKEDGRIY